MSAHEILAAEYRSHKGKYAKVQAKHLAWCLNLIEAVRTLDATFTKAGVSGIIADWGPVADAIEMFE